MNDPEMDTAVEWRFVPWCRDHMVSADGQVMKRRSQYDSGPGLFRVLKQYKRRSGHLRVSINSTNWSVHRVVYATFTGPLTPDLVICHLDGNPANNSVANLLQDTAAVNMSHRVLHGTDCRGEKAVAAKHDDGTARKVMAALSATRRTRTGRLEYGAAARIALECGATVNFVRSLSSAKSCAWPHIKNDQALSAAESVGAGGLDRRSVVRAGGCAGAGGVAVLTVDRRRAGR